MGKHYLILLMITGRIHSDLNIEIIDKHHPSIHRIVTDVLAIESSLVVPLDKTATGEKHNNGFLLIQMTREYLYGLLEQNLAVIVGAFQNDTLVGYLILDKISEFQVLYQDDSTGNLDSPLLDEVISKSPQIGYIEQIGIKPGFARLGIGSKLIAASKQIKPQGLIADVFLSPVTHESSLHFFTRQGFVTSGTLHQAPRKDFPYPHRTQVLLWQSQDPPCL